MHAFPDIPLFCAPPDRPTRLISGGPRGFERSQTTLLNSLFIENYGKKTVGLANSANWAWI